MTNGAEEIKEIKNSISNGNVLGIAVGVLGVLFIGLTIYSLSLTVKVNKLNIKKLSAEGYN